MEINYTQLKSSFENDLLAFVDQITSTSAKELGSGHANNLKRLKIELKKGSKAGLFRGFQAKKAVI
jgi:hypothetical protein